MKKHEFRSDRRKAVITKIKIFRERGASYQEIADYLNTLGMETLNTGSIKWHKSSVFKLHQKYNQ